MFLLIDKMVFKLKYKYSVHSYNKQSTTILLDAYHIVLCTTYTEHVRLYSCTVQYCTERETKEED